MIVKLLTEHHLEVLSLTGGCRGSSESALVKLLEISCGGSNVSQRTIRSSSAQLVLSHKNVNDLNTCISFYSFKISLESSFEQNVRPISLMLHAKTKGDLPIHSRDKRFLKSFYLPLLYIQSKQQH